MRTRKSWRNQERLFRYLFEPPGAKKKRKQPRRRRVREKRTSPAVASPVPAAEPREHEAWQALKGVASPRWAVQLASRIAGKGLTPVDAWLFLEHRRWQRVKPIIDREVERIERGLP